MLPDSPPLSAPVGAAVGANVTVPVAAALGTAVLLAPEPFLVEPPAPMPTIVTIGMATVRELLSGAVTLLMLPSCEITWPMPLTRLAGVTPSLGIATPAEAATVAVNTTVAPRRDAEDVTAQFGKYVAILSTKPTMPRALPNPNSNAAFKLTSDS